MKLRRMMLRAIPLALLFVAAISNAGEPVVQHAPVTSSSAVPSSLIFDLRWKSWSFWGADPHTKQEMIEVKAKPDQKIGKSFGGESPFTVVKILGKDCVRVQISKSFFCKQADKASGTFDLMSGDKLEAWTGGADANTTFELRVSDLDQVPAVSPDDLDEIAAVSVFAQISKDDAGTIQGVVPLPWHGHLNGFDDYVLRHVARLKNLRWLTTGPGYFSDAGYGQFKKMERLVYLNLSHSNASDAALSSLANLNRLETLALSHTKIHDSGLKYLSALPRLVDLDLQETNVSDQGITVLRNMKNLRTLSLNGTKVTPVGFRELRRALPNCVIKPDQ